MGFGIMFLGCFLLAETAGIELLGFVLLFWGMKVASKYCTCFKIPEKLCYIGFAISALKLVNQIADMMGAEFMNASAENIFASVYTAFMVIFYSFFFLGIAKIANDTGLSSIRNMAYANIFLASVFMIASRVCYYLVSFASADVLGERKGQVLGTAMLLPLLVVILAAILVFRCYMHICVEGDEEMDLKKGRFKSPLDYYENDKYKKNTVNQNKQRSDASKRRMKK